MQWTRNNLLVRKIKSSEVMSITTNQLIGFTLSRNRYLSSTQSTHCNNHRGAYLIPTWHLFSPQKLTIVTFHSLSRSMQKLSMSALGYISLHR